MPTLTIQDATGSRLDTYITCEEGQEDTNHGDEATMDALNTAANLQRRILQEFNISAIAPGSTIISAILTLHGRGGLTNDEISLHRIDQHWTEAGVTWNKYDGVNAWTTPGGDYDVVADATYTPTVTYDGVAHYWTITALVQEWVDGVDNEGMLLKLTTEAGGVRGLQCYSFENPSAGRRPKLVIEYDLPVGGYAAIF